MSENNPPSPNGPPLQPTRQLPVAVLDAYSYAPHNNGSFATTGDAALGFSLPFVLNAVRRWWRLATPVGLLLAFLAAAAVWISFVKMYQADAWLRIQGSPPYVAFPSRGDSRVFVKNQIEIMRSPLVLEPVVNQPEIATLAKQGVLQEGERLTTGWLAKRIAVKSVGGSDFYLVSFAGPNPESAAKIVNAVVDSYLDFRRQEETARTQNVIELLEEERERRAHDVDALREKFRGLAKQATGKDPYRPYPSPEGTVGIVAHPFSDLQNRLVTAEFERAMLEAQIGASEKSASDHPVQLAEVTVEEAVKTHPQVQALEAALSANRARLRDYETKLADGNNDPLYKSLADEISADEQRLDKILRSLRPEVQEELRTARENNRKKELAKMLAQLDSYRLMEELLEERYRNQLQSLQDLSGETLEMKFMQADLARAEQVFERIASRITTLQTEQRAPARVELLRPAEPPRKPVEAIPYRNLVLAFLAGLFSPFGLAVLWERFVRRVSDARQLGQESRLPVLGEIARLPVRASVFPRSSSQRVGHELRVFEESVDSLRTCLALSESLQDVKVLAVTSAANNEGKTSVAVQLAVSNARASGEMALLIDGDMRSPDVHKVIEGRLSPGLVKVLNGDCSLEDAIITDWSSRVHILPAGKLRGNPHKLLGNANLKLLLDTVRSSYRHIVIDTPPLALPFWPHLWPMPVAGAYGPPAAQPDRAKPRNEPSRTGVQPCTALASLACPALIRRRGRPIWLSSSRCSGNVHMKEGFSRLRYDPDEPNGSIRMAFRNEPLPASPKPGMPRVPNEMGESGVALSV